MNFADIQVKKALSKLKKITKFVDSINMFNTATRSVGVYLEHINGTLTASASYDTSDYIPVISGESYAITRCRKIAFYDTGKVYDSGIDVVTSTSQIVTAPVSGFMRVSFYATDIYSSQVENGTTFNPFQPYGQKLAIPVDITNGLVNSTPSKNLFNPTTRTIGYSLYDTGGTLFAATLYDTSDYIPVLSNTSYAITTCRKIVFYNSSKVYISGIDVSPATSKVVTTPSNTAYMKVTFYATAVNFSQVEKGAVQTSFTTFETKTYTLLPNIVVPSVQSVLSGKVILNFGDSIAEGGGNNYIGYAKIIADANGMGIYSKAVGGATVRVVSGNTNNILNQINNATETNVDYILLEGLTNDAYTTVTDDPAILGSISVGYSASLNTSTFCGAFESILKTTITKWMGKKILYVLTHKMDSRDKSSTDTLQSLAKEMLNKWSIPYVDLYNEGGLNTNIQEFKNTYTDAGGTHPNALGYNTYYVPRIEAKMKML